MPTTSVLGSDALFLGTPDVGGEDAVSSVTPEAAHYYRMDSWMGAPSRMSIP